MSLRATVGNTDDYGRLHEIDIYDDQWGGGVTDLKGTGPDYASFEHQKIDPRKPWENPIQKGVLEFSVWIEDETLLDDIKAGDEQRFYVIHSIDGNQQWQGYIYNDLCKYEEGFDTDPYRATFIAKDFTDLGGKDYLVSGSLPDTRETVISTIAKLLSRVGFDIPIKTHTSWIEENINSSQDYLRQIYHETKALRKFGRTGDEQDQPISVEDALNKLLSNHRLILRQADGAYWINQLTAYDDATSVFETNYDSSGAFQSDSNVDTTVDANGDVKITIRQDNRDNSGLPGIKRASVKFDHRTEVSGVSFPDLVELEDGQTTGSDYEQFFIGDGTQELLLAFDVYCETDLDQDSMQGRVKVTIDNHYLQDDQTFSTTQNLWYEIDLTFRRPFQGGGGTWSGSASIEADIPNAADGILRVEFAGVAGNVDFADFTRYSAIDLQIQNPVASENSTSINYQLTQTENYSVVSESEDTFYGDGPIGYSVAALRYSSNDADTTGDSWQRRGATSYRNFHENHLKEPMDLQREWRRLLSATVKGAYNPTQVISYDGDQLYYLGGSQDLFTGNWSLELFNIEIETASDDTFDDIPKFTDETGSGSGSTGGTSGGGLDQPTADARYFEESKNLSEGDSATIRSNLGLGDLSTQSTINNNDWSGADLSIANGGTGASSASAARTNLSVLSSTEISDTYLEESNNLSDLTDPNAAIINLGLPDIYYTEGEVDSLLNLYTSETELFPNDPVQPLGASDSPTFAGGAFNGNVDINKNEAILNLGIGGHTGEHGIRFYDSDNTVGLAQVYRTTPEELLIEDGIDGTRLWSIDKSGNNTVSGLLTAQGGIDLGYGSGGVSAGDIGNVGEVNLSSLTSNNADDPILIKQAIDVTGTLGYSTSYIARFQGRVDITGHLITNSLFDETTNIGKVGNLSRSEIDNFFSSTATPQEYTDVPIGTRLFSYSYDISNAPANHGYFQKIANKDKNGGYVAMWYPYQNANDFYVGHGNDSSLPTWDQIALHNKSVTFSTITSTGSLIAQGGIDITSNRLNLIEQGIVSSAGESYPSYPIRMAMEGWDTNQERGRLVDAHIQLESLAENHYPDATITFYEEDASQGNWQVKIPVRGSGSSYSHPDAAYFNGNVAIKKTSASEALDVNGNINVTGVSYADNHAEGTSDPRLKSNYELLDPLDIARHAIVRSYDKEGREGREIGLRTDEIKKGHPLLVGEKSHPEYETVETLSPYSLASVALAGVGKLNKKVETNAEKIERIEQENEQLKQELQQLKN